MPLKKFWGALSYCIVLRDKEQPRLNSPCGNTLRATEELTSQRNLVGFFPFRTSTLWLKTAVHNSACCHFSILVVPHVTTSANIRQSHRFRMVGENLSIFILALLGTTWTSAFLTFEPMCGSTVLQPRRWDQDQGKTRSQKCSESKVSFSIAQKGLRHYWIYNFHCWIVWALISELPPKWRTEERSAGRGINKMLEMAQHQRENAQAAMDYDASTQDNTDFPSSFTDGFNKAFRLAVMYTRRFPSRIALDIPR